MLVLQLCSGGKSLSSLVCVMTPDQVPGATVQYLLALAAYSSLSGPSPIRPQVFLDTISHSEGPLAEEQLQAGALGTSAC